jgi:Nif-specific regulatory protein
MVANLVGQTIRLQRLVSRDRERLMEDRRRLERELDQTTRHLSNSAINGVVGESEALQAVIEKVRVVARSNTTVLLRGESGTGKELFARAIHDLSPRKGHTYVKVNCAALPETVLESELFGHERGSFTGATSARKGRFELAHGGTLFLDEIGEISPAFQAKLLRVLQEGEFERVGGTSTMKVDVRIVVATNRNLEEAVANGEFRADLYYRIGVIPISLPALRDRKSDIPLLANEFLARFDKEHGARHELSDDAKSLLSKCPFPGNVRELENCVRRTATLSTDRLIRATSFACTKGECLSAALWQHTQRLPAFSVGRLTLDSSRGFVRQDGRPESGAPSLKAPMPVPHVETGDERQRLVRAMESSAWVQAKAARLLGLTPRQIGYALRKYDVPIKRF